MFVYRVAQLKYKDETLSGIGAEKLGGRWNEPGIRAVYCSENISLALLEYYVHSFNTALLPKQIGVARIFIPDDFIIEELPALPENWNHFPYTHETSRVFGEYTRRPHFFALKVPSSIAILESNIILNPLHPRFNEVHVAEWIEIPTESRLRKS